MKERKSIFSSALIAVAISIIISAPVFAKQKNEQCPSGQVVAGVDGDGDIICEDSATCPCFSLAYIEEMSLLFGPFADDLVMGDSGNINCTEDPNLTQLCVEEDEGEGISSVQRISCFNAGEGNNRWRTFHPSARVGTGNEKSCRLIAEDKTDNEPSTVNFTNQIIREEFFITDAQFGACSQVILAHLETILGPEFACVN